MRHLRFLVIAALAIAGLSGAERSPFVVSATGQPQTLQAGDYLRLPVTGPFYTALVPTATADRDISLPNADTALAGLSVANTWLAAQTLNTGTTTIATADINGGAIDGTAIGAASPSTASVTTFGVSGILTSTNTTEASSTTAAAAVFNGGVGIVKRLRVGGGLIDLSGSTNPYLGLADGTGTAYVQVVSGDLNLTPRATKGVTVSGSYVTITPSVTCSSTLTSASTSDASIATVGGFQSTRSGGSGSVLSAFVAAEGTARFNINGSGTVTWGSGSAARDCTLSRATAGTMRFEGADAGTTSALNVFTISHNTSGTPAAGFGVAIALSAETTTTENTIAGRMIAAWSDATHATRTSSLTVEVVTSGSSVTAATFDRPATATYTGLMLWDADNGTVERVTVGAADSGDPGFKVLQIPN